MLSDGHQRVAILRRDDFFGDQVGGAASEGLRDGGARVVADVAYDPDAASLGRKVRTMLRRKPKAVIVAGFDDDGARVVASLVSRGAGPDTMPIYGPDTMQSLDFAAAVDPANPATVAGIKGTAPAPAPANVTSPFHPVLADRGIPPIFSSHSYDCTILIALAAVKAKSDDPDDDEAGVREEPEGHAPTATRSPRARHCSSRARRSTGAGRRRASSASTPSSPGAASFDTWSYDATGQLVAGDPTAQIQVP